MEAMERLMKGRTTFMIAHRLSTLDQCDLLLEVNDGRVMEVRRDSSESSAYRENARSISSP
jgi:ATP-binding cassette subfamily B protein